MIPVAFSAERGNRIVRLDSGFTDAGSSLTFSLESAPLAPAGVEGDCLFDRLRLVLTWSAGATLTVTPLLDGVVISESAHQIVLPPFANRQSEAFELILRRKGSSVHTYGLRGTWFAVRLEGTVSSVGDMIVDPSTLEYEVLTPTQEQS
jgi:hypothetical protein